MPGEEPFQDPLSSAAVALWLCQLPEMTPTLALRLVDACGTPAEVLRAPTSRLRALGVPPPLVARLVGGARAVAHMAAGAQALQRLGIVPLPLLAPQYPERLRALPQPPLVVYLQGAWPSPPLCCVIAPPMPEPAVLAAWRALEPELRRVVGLAVPHEALPLTAPCLLGLPDGLLQARQSLPAALRHAPAGEQPTLLSLTAPTSAAETGAADALHAALIALCDALVLLAPADHQLIATAHALNRGVFVVAPPGARLPRGVRRLWRASDLRHLWRALGLQLQGAAAVQQERLL